MLRGHLLVFLARFGATCPIRKEESLQANKVLLTHPFYPLMKYFCPERNVVLQDSVHIHTTRRLQYNSRDW